MRNPLAGQMIGRTRMATTAEMSVSVEDARWFHQRIDEIVRGPQRGHDPAVIRRLFRGYLHCWKTVLHCVREAKGLGDSKQKWIGWCQRWQASQLDSAGRHTMDQLRETRDFDTHSGNVVVSGEIAAGLFPVVFVDPVIPTHVRRELVTFTNQGLDVLERLVTTYATTS